MKRLLLALAIAMSYAAGPVDAVGSARLAGAGDGGNEWG